MLFDMFIVCFSNTDSVNRTFYTDSFVIMSIINYSMGNKTILCTCHLMTIFTSFLDIFKNIQKLFIICFLT